MAADDRPCAGLGLHKDPRLTAVGGRVVSHQIADT
jgi:hypothetical protein